MTSYYFHTDVNSSVGEIPVPYTIYRNVNFEKNVLRVSDDTSPTRPDDTYTMYSVESSHKLITCDIRIDGSYINCVADSGAALNIMPVSYFLNMQWEPTSVKLKSYGGTALNVIGAHTFKVCHLHKDVEIEFYGVNVVFSYDCCDEEEWRYQNMY